MAVQRHQIDITTDAAGAATAYSAYTVSGEVKAVVYAKGSLAAGVDLTITGEKSGISILTITDGNADAQYAPRMATHSTAGAAALYAGGGSAVLGCIPVGLERIKVVVAQGGNTLSGTLHVYIES